MKIFFQDIDDSGNINQILHVNLSERNAKKNKVATSKKVFFVLCAIAYIR